VGEAQTPLALPPPPRANLSIPWAFADIRATVLGPSLVRVDWMPLAGNYIYDVYRDNTLIATVPISTATPQSVNDGGVGGGGTHTYSIAARAPSSVTTPPIAGQPGLPPVNTSLQTSKTVTITIAPLVPPPGLTASIDPKSSGVVHLAWPAPASWQPAFVVTRNGQNIGTATALGLTDTLPGPGWYSYRITSVVTQSNGQVASSAPSAQVTIHSGPFRVLAFGDSVMWGQGLSEPDKFTSLVRDWLVMTLGMPVFLTNAAHSGAIVTQPPTPILPAVAIAAVERSTATAGGVPNQYGEVPNSFPTISYQGTTIGAAQGNPNLVDLILVDGCINDVGVMTVLDPGISDNDLHARIFNACSTQQLTLLSALHNTYRNARIVVTGYFKIASTQSDISLLNVFAMRSGVPAEAIGATLLGSTVGAVATSSVAPLIDPLTGSLLAGVGVNVALDAYRKVADDHSAIFVRDSTTLLQQNVNSINQLGAGTIAALAVPPFGDANAYAAPNSWLWRVPVAPNQLDEAYSQRQATCQHVPANDPTYDGMKCPFASMGHPNVTGAQRYALAIEGQLQQLFVAGWRKAFAPTQSVP
jgi:lysophospholipase L1-like esterase